MGRGSDSNSVDGYVGRVFVVDALSPVADTFYALKTTGGETVGIDVKISLSTNDEIQEG